VGIPDLLEQILDLNIAAEEVLAGSDPERQDEWKSSL